MQQEIDELRNKINAIGSVNLESLDELDTLETRYQTLSEQYQRPGRREELVGKDHRQDQYRQPAAV